MKKYILLAGMLFVSQFTFAQSIINLINRSDAFFENLDQGKYDDAYAFFDESVKAKLNADALKNLWTNITTELGSFESVDGAQNRTRGGYYLVTLNCKFSKGMQAFQLAYNSSEKMVGFFIAPKNNAATYVSPAYADTALYKEKNITLKFGKNELAGMLTTPKKGTNFPVVVLVHGSGPSDMDETVGPNKPFKDLAAGLAAKGIATIRYVKRTMVYPNEFTKTYTVKEEVTDDALSAIAFAKSVPEINKKEIYVFGHSMGGMLAPKLAALAPDLNGIILAAAPARKFTDLIIEQNKYAFEIAKDTTAEGKKQLEDALKEIEKSRISELGNIAADSTVLGIPASYWVDLNQYDQVAAAKKLKKRMLIIQGGNDFQVSTQHYDIWKNELGKKKNVTFKLYPELNHLLSPQTEKGTMSQYEKAGNVADYLVNDIAAWIKAK